MSHFHLHDLKNLTLQAKPLFFHALVNFASITCLLSDWRKEKYTFKYLFSYTLSICICGFQLQYIFPNAVSPKLVYSPALSMKYPLQ